jgi:hypothetical protein
LRWEEARFVTRSALTPSDHVEPRDERRNGDMKEILDQWTKTMGKMWDPWQKMMTDLDFMKGQVRWTSWLAAMRSSYDVNASWWQMFMDQTEEVFFKAFKESPFYNQAAEEQMREYGANLRKTYSMQQDSVKEYLDRMESLLKEKEGS